MALPAGTKWLAVPALKTRLAIPTSWKAVDLAALREQKGTPAFAKAAAGLGYTEQELADFTASGAVAMAVGPDAGETAPNLLVRSVGGGTFSDGEQLTSGSRGATGTLDAQSKATTPGGPAVRGDWHAPLDGLTVHASQLAVEVSGQQDIVTVAAQDAQTVKKVMDGVVASYSPAP
ncbi:hypothetical protein ADJ73_05200 [Arsenicicoccus sp. oral taxon 190]|nr:hypothetical protein ADJ73_05200 [Arsenicicoccus sp. oral taxon 190]